MATAMHRIATNNVMDQQMQYLLNKILYDAIEENKDEWYPRLDLRNATFNVVFGALFGKEKQLKRSNPAFIQLSDSTRTWTQEMGVAILANLFYVPPIFDLKKRLRWRTAFIQDYTTRMTK